MINTCSIIAYPLVYVNPEQGAWQPIPRFVSQRPRPSGLPKQWGSRRSSGGFRRSRWRGDVLLMIISCVQLVGSDRGGGAAVQRVRVAARGLAARPGQLRYAQRGYVGGPGYRQPSPGRV